MLGGTFTALNASVRDEERSKSKDSGFQPKEVGEAKQRKKPGVRPPWALSELAAPWFSPRGGGFQLRGLAGCREPGPP